MSPQLGNDGALHEAHPDSGEKPGMRVKRFLDQLNSSSIAMGLFQRSVAYSRA